MNIILTCDNKFVPYCASTIASVLANNTDVSVWLLTDGLKKADIQKLDDLCRDMGSELNVRVIDSKTFGYLPMLIKEHLKHISLATYFRLFISELLPENIEKILYLDCDIIVRRDLKELFEIDLEGYALGAVYHSDDFSIKNGAFGRLNIPVKQGYFNAGVLLVNLKYWRENDVYNRIVSFINTNYSKIINHDQDVLNAVLGDKVLLLDCCWNMMTFFFTEAMLLAKDTKMISYKENILKNGYLFNPHIVHFVYRPKPWEKVCIHPFRKDFFCYLRKTSWKNYPLKSSTLKDILRLTIYAYIKGYGRFINKKRLMKKGEYKYFNFYFNYFLGKYFLN